LVKQSRPVELLARQAAEEWQGTEGLLQKAIMASGRSGDGNNQGESVGADVKMIELMMKV
jgi:hypothetical protein